MTSKTNYYDLYICVIYHPSFWYHKSFEWTINRRTILKLVYFVTTSPSLPYNTSHNNCKHAPTCAMISSTPGFETLLAPNICTLKAPRRRGGPRSPTVGTTAPIKASRVAASSNTDRPRIAISFSAQTCRPIPGLQNRKSRWAVLPWTGTARSCNVM